MLAYLDGVKRAWVVKLTQLLTLLYFLFESKFHLSFQFLIKFPQWLNTYFRLNTFLGSEKAVLLEKMCREPSDWIWESSINIIFFSLLWEWVCVSVSEMHRGHISVSDHMQKVERKSNFENWFHICNLNKLSTVSPHFVSYIFSWYKGPSSILWVGH